MFAPFVEEAVENEAFVELVPSVGVVKFALVRLNTISSPSRFPEPLEFKVEFNDNLKVNVLLELSPTETLRLLNAICVEAIFDAEAIKVDPSNKAIVFMASSQLSTAFPEFWVKVIPFTIVGRLSASLLVAPPSRTVICHTWAPSAKDNGGSLFRREDIVADSELATATTSLKFEGVVAEVVGANADK